jgi:predicted amidohydrolase YtcJ
MHLGTLRRASALIALTALVACGDSPDAADLVLTNGKIVTVDPAHPEAEALAVRDGLVMAVGTSAEMEAFVGSGTQVVDLDGRLAIPGFIEGHGHYTSLGQAKMILDLNNVANWDEIVDMVAAAASEAEPGTWIAGRGWHQEKWDYLPEGAVDGVPVHTSLSAVSPNNPVILGHASGHAAYANAAAMELAGIDRTTPNPEGGTIVRDAAGNATGLLRENADALVYGVMGEEMAARSADEQQAEFERIVALAAQDALSKGVTTFHDAGSDFATIDGFKRMADAGRLPVRLYVMVRFESNDAMRERLPDYRMVGYGQDHLTVRSMPEDIEETARIAAEYGFQVNTHAIGDRANREVLDIYERAFAATEGMTTQRWRIEHAQHVHPDDIGRFAELGIIASMQGIHCTSDAPWVFRRLGPERAESGAYMWRSFIDAGVTVTNGTDVPVEDIDPIASFYSSVVRKDKDGNDFFPDQRMTRMEALASYTINNAYAAFEEDLKGSLTPGKLADITVLDRDIMTVPDEDIPNTHVDMTIVGGDVRFERNR